MHSITLYHYWRSSCSWRVRWALAIKNINYQDVAINLLKNEQRSPTYLKLNPSGLVPTLDIDGMQLSESLAIIEYLEDRFSNHRPLLPQNRIERAKIREVANILMTIQSVQNLRVLKKHSSDPAEQKNWAKWVIEEGLMALKRNYSKVLVHFALGVR
jgi:maleylacetoacetate isomerase